MARTMTADQMAIRIMLDSTLTASQRDRNLSTLSKQVHAAMNPKCPECGSTDVDDNGDTYFGVTCCCLTCGHQWQRDAEEV